MRDVESIWRINPQLRALRPRAIHLLEAANERAWRAVSPVLLEQIRLRIANLIGNEAGLLRRSRAAREQGLTEAKIAQLAVYYKSDDFSALEKHCLTFAEQFVIDVSSITEADTVELRHSFNAEQLQDFVTAIYVTECTQRLEMVASALLSSRAADSSDSPSADGQATDQEEFGNPLGGIILAFERYQEAVMLGTALDPVTTEVVRLRCARTHGCRICKSLRLLNAREAGVDDTLTAKIDSYEKSDLDERLKIALRITDAFITRPQTLTEAAIQRARLLFTQDALAELCLDITKWSTQKIYVALGTDADDGLPKNESGVCFFGFDADGRVRDFADMQEIIRVCE